MISANEQPADLQITACGRDCGLAELVQGTVNVATAFVKIERVTGSES